MYKTKTKINGTGKDKDKNMNKKIRKTQKKNGKETKLIKK